MKMTQLIQDKQGNFLVVERRVDLVNGRSVSVPVRTRVFSERQIDDMVNFMYLEYETPARDTRLALQHFEELGYNKAEFGLWGGYVFSTFEGVTH